LKLQTITPVEKFDTFVFKKLLFLIVELILPFRKNHNNVWCVPHLVPLSREQARMCLKVKERRVVHNKATKSKNKID
jgi:hypothetical protein